MAEQANAHLLLVRHLGQGFATETGAEDRGEDGLGHQASVLALDQLRDEQPAEHLLLHRRVAVDEDGVEVDRCRRLDREKIGSAQVCTPVTTEHSRWRLLLENKKTTSR